jgi:hypothetical protein
MKISKVDVSIFPVPEKETRNESLGTLSAKEYSELLYKIAIEVGYIDAVNNTIRARNKIMKQKKIRRK